MGKMLIEKYPAVHEKFEKIMPVGKTDAQMMTDLLGEISVLQEVEKSRERKKKKHEEVASVAKRARNAKDTTKNLTDAKRQELQEER